MMAQGGVCAICQRPSKPLRRDSDNISLAVDHDHETNVVRGHPGDTPGFFCVVAAYLENPPAARLT